MAISWRRQQIQADWGLVAVIGCRRVGRRFVTDSVALVDDSLSFALFNQFRERAFPVLVREIAGYAVPRQGSCRVLAVLGVVAVAGVLIERAVTL